MFTDRVKIELRAGKGGNGIIAWRREKYIPKGGPFGGDGGDGGSIVIEADCQIPSLEGYRNRRLLKAENGGQGGPNNRHGKNGRPLVLKVPCGTLLKDMETGEILHDFTQHKEQMVICSGGKGGKGNTHFKTPTNRAPAIATPGKWGQIRSVELELKLIADVGLVGFPNAGKSTLIYKAANVPVKIAPYPFTTLRPNLGYIFFEGGERILIADIPGIIKGAHHNKGLGLEFLRHIERTHLLLYVIDVSGFEGRNPLEDFAVLRQEVALYNPALLEKPSVVALNKIDFESSNEHIEAFRCAYPNETVVTISALNNQGVDGLVALLKRKLSR